MEVVVEVPPPKSTVAGVPIRPPPTVFVRSQVELPTCFVQLQLYEVTSNAAAPALVLVRNGLDGDEFCRLQGGRAVFSSVRIASRQPGARWQAVLRYLLCAAPDRGGLSTVDKAEAWSLPFLVDETVPLPSNFRLDLLMGPTGVVFKETRIHLKMKLSALGGPQPVTLPDYFKLCVSLEDEHGVPIRSIAAGPHIGEPILSRAEFDTPLNSRWELDINDIRIREVSRNHGGAAFRLLVHLLEYPHVPPAASALFFVRSERIRAPSYAAQLQSQRQQRAARVRDPLQSGSPQTTGGGGVERERDRDRDDPSRGAADSEDDYTEDEE